MRFVGVRSEICWSLNGPKEMGPRVPLEGVALGWVDL